MASKSLSEIFDPFHLFTKSSQEIYNEEQMKLQREQFEYQKYYDANNVQLKTQDAMKAGLNPLVATGNNTSSVTASASPQMPDSSTPATGILASVLDKAIDMKKHNDELALARDQLKLAKDKQEDEEAYRDGYLSILRSRAGADITRTEVYRQLADIQGEESKTRRQSMAHDLLIRVQDSYGTQSSTYKKVFGELKSLLGDISMPEPGTDPISAVAPAPKEKKRKEPRPESKDYYKEYNNAVENGGFKGSYESYLKRSKGFKR